MPLAQAVRECPELPAANADKLLASVVDAAPVSRADLNEASLNGLIADECEIWRDRYAVFSKPAPPKRLGQLSSEYKVTRFDAFTWKRRPM